MKRFALQVLGLLAALVLSGTASADLVEGKEYTRLKVPHAVDSGKKIEVIEFSVTAARIATISSLTFRPG
jgi:hypothetical protein